MLLGLFLLAWAVRIVYLVQIQSSPFFDTPVGDAGWHDAWARGLLRDGWSYRGVFFRAPLYPYFLAGAYSLVAGSYWGARLVQITLGSLSCLLVYDLGRHLFERRTALVSGVVAALYGVLVYFDGELLIPVLTVFLNLLMLWFLVRPWPKRTWLRWALAGLAMGLSALARPNILLFVPFLLFCIWLRPSKGQRGRALRGWGIFSLVTIMVISPAWIHNYLAGDGRVPISSQAGINFYIGNAKEADGKISAPPGGIEYEDSQKDNVWAASERIAQQEMGRRLKPSQVSLFWFRRALAEIGQEPWRWMALMGRKLYYLFNGHEIESNLSIYTSRQWSGLLGVLVWKKFISFPFGLLAPLALVGFWLSRRQWEKHLLLYSFLSAYSLSVLFFFVNFRFRLPIIPVMIIYASHVGVWAAGQIRLGRWRPLIRPAALFLLLSCVSNSRFWDVSEINFSREHYQQAVAYERKGMLQKAVAHYQETIAIDPSTVPAQYNLARIYRQGGQLEAAISSFQKVVALKPDFAEGHNGLGICYAQRGDHRQAMRHFYKAIALQPEHGWAYLNLANAYFEMSIPDSALIFYRRAQQLLPPMEYIRQQIDRLEGEETP